MTRAQEEEHKLATARSEMGKPMHESDDGFKAVVSHSICLDGFPSQTRGPLLVVYCLDENDNILVEPRHLSVAGVGVDRGPQFKMEDLRESRMTHEEEVLTWFSRNDVHLPEWVEHAILNAPCGMVVTT